VRVTLCTWGTRGDVQPYISVANELQRRGHRVVLAVNENHADWVARAGLSVVPLPFDFEALMRTDDAKAGFAIGSTAAFLEILSDREHACRNEIRAAMWEACRGADAIVASFLVIQRAAVIAEAMGIAVVGAFTYPVSPTAAYPSPFLANRMPEFARDTLRIRSHLVAQAVFRRHQQRDLLELRARLGLPARDNGSTDEVAGRRVSIVHLFDNRVLPRPVDWPDHLLVSSYCPLQPEVRKCLAEEGPEPVLAWLNAGAAPLFVSFGSVPVPDAEALMRAVRGACHELGCRLLVAAGWTLLPRRVTDEVLVTDVVNHDAVLPRCLAAMHHGGAGTTGATLTAGIPTVICSVFGDQPLWGHQVSRLRVGTSFPLQRLSVRQLVEALRAALDGEIVLNARRLGIELRAVNGVSQTVDYILRAVRSEPTYGGIS
jgi:sterol 3beta-glucosyltransferase